MNKTAAGPLNNVITIHDDERIRNHFVQGGGGRTPSWTREPAANYATNWINVEPTQEAAIPDQQEMRRRIESAFNRLKDFGRIATRCDKLARNYSASVRLAAALVGRI